MSQQRETTTSGPDQQDLKMDLLISNVLRFGLIAASSLMIVGAFVTFRHFTGPNPHLEHFNVEPENLRTIGGIFRLAKSGNGVGIMQLAVLILMATPFLRVACAALGFASQRDWKYVVISLIVLLALLYGLYAGGA
jgi:uncharacterized membrane protein